MLLLNRKVDQRIRIGHDIQILVVHVGHGKVKLGIVAPEDVAVYREEVYQRIHGMAETNQK